jgi:hypothetical protein
VRSAALLALVLVAGCFSEIDTSGLEPIDDYRDWYRIDTVGEAPGHGDSYRVIHANDIARTFAGSGLYPTGTVIIKEIRDDDGGQPGALRYIALMRKLDEAPPGGELDEGWLFSYKGDEADVETYRDRCWSSCHQNAPFDGAFFNWSDAAR